MSTTQTSDPDEPRAPQHLENSTDATRGEPLAIRAQKRKAELEVALAKLPAHELLARSDIELALSSADGLLTGDLEHLSAATGSAISRWLENTKHVAETTPVMSTPAPTAMNADDADAPTPMNADDADAPTPPDADDPEAPARPMSS